MSGFDVAAGAAGIVSLGFQLIETSIKLNRIVKAVKDAPRTVEKLVEELKTMGMFLQHIQQDHQYCPPSGAILDQCLVIFQHSTFELRELVDKMETCLAKRPRLGGKLYVAYKDHDIKELLGDLERAKTSLGFAFKMHCDEIQRQQRQTSLIALTQLVTTENANISRQLSPIAEATTELRRLQSMMSESQRQRNQAYTTALAQVASETADISRQLKAFTEYSAELRSTKGRRNEIPDLEIATTNLALSSCLGRHFFSFLLSLDDLYIQCLTSRLTNISPVAAKHGQLDICQYLLGQTIWPDHTTVLNSALGRFSLWNRRRKTDMYRLFMDDPGFHADLEADSRYLWLHWCEDVGALDVVLQTQLLSFKTQPAELRFEIVSRVRFLSASAFIRCIGLDPSEPELANLQSQKGLTVLHYVASHLWRLAQANSAAHGEEVLSWVSIGASVLRNGAKPCAIADIENDLWLAHGDSQSASRWHRQEVFTKVTRTTPLMICVGHPDWQIRTAGSAECVHNFRRISKTLRIWVEMVQNAGFDLENYGSEELEAWKSLPDSESYLRPNKVANPYFRDFPRITHLTANYDPELSCGVQLMKRTRKEFGN
ncbi:hypothetical protein J7T55_003710 [Diaporthe amygdali]|uniref:uncharacterized protein n=1 Tax=Phomopsis amygdali TaxID=1214568 RepID=UPI0022FDB4F2|nr:uncharacterized protein J7T55_003710 [Diaporthe amygdali]KAJ0117298.1 hypothetical protein J7T55_003710 [Diaporthe amygdali]